MKDDRGDLDLTKQLETQEKELKTLNDVVVNLKNIIDGKEAEITAYQSKQTALYEEVKRLKPYKWSWKYNRNQNTLTFSPHK